MRYKINTTLTHVSLISGSGGALVLILLLAALGGGGAFAYIKFIKPKQGAKVSANPDDYEFEDEEYENENVSEISREGDKNNSESMKPAVRFGRRVRSVYSLLRYVVRMCDKAAISNEYSREISVCRFLDAAFEI